ncbi:hypothetical protein RB195_011300 [Necator americanus]|uniref:Uncharacterized protein n=1 Tax=Necator americanus TaxID=51031 RepID=A0ABR1D1S2_NECAM
MLLHLLSALTLLLASEDLVCHPFLSEFSTLRFRTTADLQYIELAVTEECQCASYGGNEDFLIWSVSTQHEVTSGNVDSLTVLHLQRHMILHEALKRLRRHQA